MVNKIKTLVLSLIATSALLAPVAVAGTVGAQPNIGEKLKEGTCLEVGNPDCETGTGAEATVNTIIEDVVNIFSIVVGVVAVIMIIIGGLKYITSSGDSGNVTSAKNTILYAIIGLIIVALAQVIVRFVLNRALDPTG